MKKIVFISTALFFVFAFCQSAHAEDWNVGDVFAGVGAGNYDVFDNNGVFKETINNGLNSVFTTGCAFRPDLTQLYTTDFAGNVVVFDDAHPHSVLNTINLNSVGTGTVGNTESVVFASDGSYYVGTVDGDNDIYLFDAADNFVTQFDVAAESRGSDWIDLASDQQTLFYTSEGFRILRYDVSTGTQLADFSLLPDRPAYALRLLPPFDGSGGLLVANNINIKRLDGAGNVIQTYDAPGEDNWFSLNLDPNGTSFWAGDFGKDNFYRFNIETGAIEVGPISAGLGNTLFGICVKGEITAAQETQVSLDIKPGSCPNPLNVKSKGVLPVAILGTEEFDVYTIDPATVRLTLNGNGDGVPSLRSAYEDVATPFEAELCDCHDYNGDGYQDLTLKFDTPELVEMLGLDSYSGDITLTVKGNLYEEFGGTPIIGWDCIRIK